MAPLVWLVTGATSGLGKTLISHIVSRGDKVVATGRHAEQRIADLKSDSVAIINLDVSAGRDIIDAQVKKAWESFGRIDVLVNNAGFSAPKSIEEASDEFLQGIFNVNVFGPMRITQSILPYFRLQQGGTIAFIGAGVAWAPIPFLSHYSASKAALDMFVEGLHKEVRDQNIRCTIFELGGFASQLGLPREGSDEGFGKFQPAIRDYEGLFSKAMDVFAKEIAPNIPGDVVKMANAIVDMVKGEGAAKERKLPVRVVLGSDALKLVTQKCQEQLGLSNEFEDISLSTDRDDLGQVSHEGMLRLTSMLGRP